MCQLIKTTSKLNVENKIREDLEFFAQVARPGRQNIDLVKALRRERDRDEKYSREA